MLPEDIDGPWDTWQGEFLKTMELTIPKSTQPNRRNVPWLNKSICAGHYEVKQTIQDF